MHGLVTDDDYRVSRLQELELLDEHRQAVYDHLRVYQKRISRGYNKKFRHREFQVGDLVLRENPKNQSHRECKGKFEPNWLGPFLITTTFGSGAYQLSMTKGE